MYLAKSSIVSLLIILVKRSFFSAVSLMILEVSRKGDKITLILE